MEKIFDYKKACNATPYIQGLNSFAKAMPHSCATNKAVLYFAHIPPPNGDIPVAPR